MCSQLAESPLGEMCCPTCKTESSCPLPSSSDLPSDLASCSKPGALPRESWASSISDSSWLCNPGPMSGNFSELQVLFSLPWFPLVKILSPYCPFLPYGTFHICVVLELFIYSCILSIICRQKPQFTHISVSLFSVLQGPVRVSTFNRYH